jgi:hypothetical protein
MTGIPGPVRFKRGLEHSSVLDRRDHAAVRRGQLAGRSVARIWTRSRTEGVKPRRTGKVNYPKIENSAELI